MQFIFDLVDWDWGGTDEEVTLWLLKNLGNENKAWDFTLNKTRNVVITIKDKESAMLFAMRYGHKTIGMK